MRNSSVWLMGVLAVAALACSDLDRTRLRAHLGGSDSQLTLAYRYSTGNGVEKNEELAFRWYLRAAEQGHPEAQLVVGNRYMMGLGVKRDPAQGLEWFRKSAEQGNVEATETIEALHRSGAIAPADPQQ